MPTQVTVVLSVAHREPTDRPEPLGGCHSEEVEVTTAVVPPPPTMNLRERRRQDLGDGNSALARPKAGDPAEVGLGGVLSLGPSVSLPNTPAPGPDRPSLPVMRTFQPGESMPNPYDWYRA